MTIEERTRRKGSEHLTEDELTRLNKIRGINSAFEIGYYLGATDQEKIDIDKACEWLKEHFNIILDENKENGVALCECPFTEEMENAFRKAMEEEQ